MEKEQTRSRRRWFQFSLTSLFLLTTLVAIWLAWELAFIHERQTWLRENAVLVDPIGATNQITSPAGPGTISFVQIVPPPPAVPRSIPWWRRMLGDEAVPAILEGEGWADDDHARVA